MVILSPGRQPGGRPPVGLREPGRVHPQRRHPAAALPEATSDGADVDARGDQLGRGVMAQVVQVGVDPQPPDEPAVPLRHRRREEVLRPVGREREDERVAAADFIRAEGLEAFCRAVLNSNEFLFIP